MEELTIIMLLVNTFPLTWKSKTNTLFPHKQTNTQPKNTKNPTDTNETPGEQGECKVIILISHFKFVLDLG